jgi:hypothetical protein
MNTNDNFTPSNFGSFGDASTVRASFSVHERCTRCQKPTITREVHFKHEGAKRYPQKGWEYREKNYSLYTHLLCPECIEIVDTEEIVDG